VTFKAGQTDGYKFLGLRPVTEIQNHVYTTLDYSIECMDGGGSVAIFENNTSSQISGAWTPETTFEIRRVGTTITYHRGGSLIYTSTVPSSGPLVVDTAFHTQGSSIVDIAVTGANPRVSSWADQIGGVTIAQSAAAKCPQRNASGAFPHLELRADLGTFLTGPALNVGGAYTIVAVQSVSVPSPTNEYGIIAYCGDLAQVNGFAIVTSPGTPAIIQQDHIGIGFAGNFAETSDLCWLLASYDSNVGTTPRMMRNGTAYTTGAIGGHAAQSGAFTVGASNLGSYPCSSDLREVFVCNTKLTAAEEAQVAAYMAREYAL
jgi:hypothetical protein